MFQIKTVIVAVVVETRADASKKLFYDLSTIKKKTSKQLPSGTEKN